MVAADSSDKGLCAAPDCFVCVGRNKDKRTDYAGLGVKKIIL
jgi:hypothetical protein